MMLKTTIFLIFKKIFYKRKDQWTSKVFGKFDLHASQPIPTYSQKDWLKNDESPNYKFALVL